MSGHRAYLVFYGTETAIVRAESEDGAWLAFRDAWRPGGRPSFGRLAPPIRDEVTIREPRESDRGWIEDSGNSEFLALLPKVSA